MTEAAEIEKPSAKLSHDDFARACYKHADTLKHQFNALCRNPVLAEDLLQETYMRALEKRHLYQEGNLGGWLYTIGLNLHRGAVRRLRRTVEDPEEQWQAQLESLPNQEDSLYLREVLERINHLPLIHRQTIRLAALGFTLEEMSNYLHLPIGTVKSRVFRARQALNAELLLVLSADRQDQLRRGCCGGPLVRPPRRLRQAQHRGGLNMARIAPIRTEADHRAALARIDELMDAQAGTPEADELSVLADLVEIYEAKHFPIERPTPLEAIRFRMEQAGLGPRDLEPYIGSRGKVSEVLAGKQPLTLPMIRALHRHLGIPAEVLLKNWSPRPKNS